jgi:hypothetical protein
VTETGGASGVTESEAKLEGKINPEGEDATYVFEYGTTTAYRQTAPTPPATIENGACGLICEINTPQPVSAKLTELEPGSVYHYRLVATSGPGYRRYGNDATFTTPGSHARLLGGEETPPSTGGNGQPGTSGTSSASGGPSSTPGATPITSPVVKTVKPKTLTKARKLAKALRQCKKEPKRKRASCDKQARKHYGTVANKSKKR